MPPRKQSGTGLDRFAVRCANARDDGERPYPTNRGSFFSTIPASAAAPSGRISSLKS